MQQNNTDNNYIAYLDRMPELNPAAEYPTGLEKAIIGICDNHFENQPERFAVSYSKSIDLLAEQFSDLEDPREAAIEWWYYNVAGSYTGVNGPIYVYDGE